MDVRVFAVAVAGVLFVFGLALGAESQRETFLHPEALQDVGLSDAAGNLVVLTALLPAAAVGLGVGLVDRRPALGRIGPVVGAAVATYVVVALVQSSWPNYDAIIEQRTASFSITPLISNGGAVPTVFLAPLAILLAATLMLHRALRPRSVPGTTPAAALRRVVEAYALAAPFLLMLALGNLRLLLALPNGDAATVPYLFVFPSSALAALGLVVVGAMKAWHLGTYVRNSRLADSVSDLWQGLRRVEWVLAGILGGLAILATVLQPIPSPLLEAGRTFGVSARGHVQAQFLLLLPLIGWFTLDRRVQAALGHRAHAATLSIGPHPLVLGTLIAIGIGAIGAAITTWSAHGALWPWAAMLAPVVLYSWFRFQPLGALWPAVVLATVLWGIGNTVVGIFRLTQDADNALTLQDPPGVLALFRFLAVLVAAVAVARLARSHAAHLRPPVAWPLAALIGGAVALILFMEASFTAWIAPRSQGEFVGIGSLIASQDRSVRVTMHLLAGTAAFLAGMAIARIHRPDWFRRQARPVPAPGGAQTAQTTQGAATLPPDPARPAAPPGESAT